MLTLIELLHELQIEIVRLRYRNIVEIINQYSTNNDDLCLPPFMIRSNNYMVTCVECKIEDTCYSNELCLNCQYIPDGYIERLNLGRVFRSKR